MKKNSKLSEGELHRQAEAKLKKQKEKTQPVTKADTLRILHKLQVNQIELEMQNEELIQARTEAEEAYRQYTDLYDFAPVGYFTLTRNGTVRRANLAGANLLGIEHVKFINRRLGLFVADKSRAVFAEFLEKLASGRGKETCELAFTKNGNELTWARLESTCFEDGLESRAVVMDISERKEMESVLEAHMRISEFVESHTFDELLQKTLDEAEALTDSQVGFAHFVDADQKMLNLQMWSTNTLKNMCSAEGKEEHYTIDQAGVWADCVLTRAPLIHNDYPNLAHRKGLPKGHAPIQRELVVPVLQNDLIVMIMGVGNKLTDYNERDVRTLSRLADSAWEVVQRKRAEDALKISEKKYRLLYESMIDGFVSTDMAGNILEFNESYRKMLGYSEAELTQLTYMDITPEKWHAFEFDLVENQIIKRGYSELYEKEYRKKDGTIFPAELRTVLLYNEKGKPVSMWAIVRDISRRKQAEEALRLSEVKFRTVANFTYDWEVWRGPDGLYRYISPSCERITGHTAAEFMADADLILKITYPDDLKKVKEHFENAFKEFKSQDINLDFRIITPDEKLHWIEHSCTAVYDENGQWLGRRESNRDITERKLAEIKLRHLKEELQAANHDLKSALMREQQLARTDVLTGVNNRRHLYKIADHEFEVAARYQQPISVIMLDIDHFKKINDTFGHAVGDQILQRVTQTACTELRSADMIGRYGGEEFLIVLPMTNAQQAYLLAERLRVDVEALSIPTPKGDACVTLSIGVVEMWHVLPAESVESVFRRADEAMYTAKQAGRNRTEIGE